MSGCFEQHCIAVFIYQSCSILASLECSSKYKWQVKIFSNSTHKLISNSSSWNQPKICLVCWLYKLMLLSCKTVVHIEPFNKIHNNKYYYYISFESLQMYSCGSLAPKMRRGGGCADHLFRRPAEPWEKGDGWVTAYNMLGNWKSLFHRLLAVT